ncbi:MAG TPA: TIGR03118 family protein [Caldimonas sp.]|nr:TIGR03118 family protein [Caldimonas sp.]
MNPTLSSPLLLRSRLAGIAALSLAALGLSSPASAQYAQTNLVSNIPGLAAITDPRLVNPWGISRSATSPFWTSNQGMNSSTLYAITGSTNVSQVLGVNANGFVAIPTTAAGPQGPTGQVSNSNTASFQLTPGTASSSARFIFADLNGTISGWAGGLTSTVGASTPGAVYTGLAINTAGTRLYAADSAGGHVNVFDSGFAPVSLPGSFTDPTLPSGFVPFNVQDIAGKVYVTYAPAGVAAQRAAAPGAGFVSVFDENGAFMQRLVSGSRLAAPWGVALAPAGFGPFGGDLLVGNFSFASSVINAFDPLTGLFQGSIPIDVGAGNTPGGLWGLMFGSGAGSGGDANTLYFLDGINGETAGLFGAVQAVPEPEILALLGVGLAAIGWRRRRRMQAKGS